MPSLVDTTHKLSRKGEISLKISIFPQFQVKTNNKFGDVNQLLKTLP